MVLIERDSIEHANKAFDVDYAIETLKRFKHHVNR